MNFRSLPASVETQVVERSELERLVPGIRPEWRRALFEPSCADIDVAALHAAYLRRFRATGGRLITGARGLRERDASERGWQVELEDGATLRAAVIVNAAGAWADEVAVPVRSLRSGSHPSAAPWSS